MQVIETQNEGLRRGFKIVLPSAEIQAKVDDRLQEIAASVNLPGFRPGKVPKPIVKQRFGAAITGEVLEKTVSESAQQVLTDRGLRPALEPKLDVGQFAEGSDFEYTVEVEVLPEITPTDFAQIELERLVADVSDEQIQAAIDRLAKMYRKTEKVEEDRPAEAGEVVVIDYKALVEGNEEPVIANQNARVEIGEPYLLPGFSERLVGVKAGSTAGFKLEVAADFPRPDVAGKELAFEVEVKEHSRFLPRTGDDALAQDLGMEDLDTLTRAIRKELEQEHSRTTRAQLKRKLLDRLAELHDFAVPQGMVDMELDGIWRGIAAQRARGVVDPETADKSEDDIKAELRPIAERRVRLGLLLAEVGRVHAIRVTPDEQNRAVVEEARNYPGQERQVMEFYRQHPEAMAQIRAPIFEDKVIDFILELAKVSERKVTREELYRVPEEEQVSGAAAETGDASNV